ncbi:hypothetical protein [Vannielia litorea]|uniref:hypothetical protein n=1 Tax=Vannielia litorea TaxID=1217970 RepID=UPI001BCB9089|nr:hypothetical protein [Vannielia litorea]MBS8227125.1 hypothetical protein [Vannielia litorea]
MTEQTNITEEVRRYCEDAGIAPSTLSLRALGNGRFFERKKRRDIKDAEDSEKLRAYMAQNPPQKQSDGETAA